MQNNSMLIAIVLLIVGLGVGYAIGGREPSVGSHIMPSGHMMADGEMMGQNIDQTFIAQMIPHHEGAIAMAQIALQRSKRPEVLSLASGIIEAQQREITQMQSWYQSWFGTAVPHIEGMMHMDGMSGDTNELSSVTDADFDREFVTQMIPHHEMAVMMAQMLQNSTGREEMKTLADQIITSQSREITMMRSWLAGW